MLLHEQIHKEDRETETMGELWRYQGVGDCGEGAHLLVDLISKFR